MPRASTSARTLDSPVPSSSAPGFRAPSARPASRKASLNISRAKAKGKERAQGGFAEWDEGGGEEGTGYAPKARQLKVRKRRRSEGLVEEEAGAKRRKEGEGDAPPEVEQKGAKKRSTRAKGKEKAVDNPAKEKKKSKKRVRIASPVPASSSGNDTDYEPSDAEASDEGDLAVQAGEGRDVEDDDWTDPFGIPTAQTVRGRRYWRLMDQGIYRSSLHDAAQSEMDVGKALVQWEALRRRREDEEVAAEEEWRALQEQKKRKDGDAEADDSQAGSPAPTSKKRGAKAAAHDPHRSLHPFPLTRDPKNAGDDPDDPRHRLEYDSDGAEILPLPSSVALAKMARWPLHSSVVGSAAPGADSLEDALAVEFERVYRRTRPEPIPRPRRRGPRSAYGPDGPLAPADPAADVDMGPESASEEDDDPHALNSDDDSPAPPAALSTLPSLLSNVLARLADCVPKSAFPAYDYWCTRKRDEEMRKDDRKKGVERDKVAVGWEEVVEVAREMGVDEHIVDKLSARLVALFGPSRKAPVTLPPPGGYPSVRVEQRRRGKKVASKELESDAGATGASGARQGADDAGGAGMRPAL